MDPKDLLLTNQFIAPNTAPRFTRGGRPREQKERREYAELKDFIRATFADQEVTELQQEQDDFESDEEGDYDLLEPPINRPQLTSVLNRPQWIHSEEPLALSQGVLPILSKSLNDTTRVRYRKQIVSYINIDSRRRNTVKFPNPGKYRIFLNKEFRNLYSIRMENIIFREPPTPINSSNNQLVWTTNYTGLPGVADGTTVEYSAIIPGAFYSLGEFVQVVETTLNAVQHVVPGAVFPNGNFPLFRLTIDPFNRSIRFIQRLEESVANTLDTTAGNNTVRLTFPIPHGITAGLPVILAGLEFFATNFGGIPVTLIEQVPFYDVGTSSPGQSTYTIISPTEIDLTILTSSGAVANANQTRTYDLTMTNLPNFPAGHPIEVTAGRAISFTVDTDQCESSFGKYIGLQDGSADILIHTNFNTSTQQVENVIPWCVVGPGQLLLDTPDYILMRIEPSDKPNGTISSNLTCAIGSVNYAEIERNSKENGYFAKIIFAGTPPGDVVTTSVGGDRLFYDAPLVKLTDLDISFYDAAGNLLELKQNHSFVLQMVELQEVLRDTLIDSRTGNIADIGAGIATTNPLD